MKTVLVFAALWIACGFAAFAAIIFAAQQPMQAELPDLPDVHDPATCETCLAADDSGVLSIFHFLEWAEQMRENA